MRKYLSRKGFEAFVEKEGAEYIDDDGNAIFKAPESLYEDTDDCELLTVAGVAMTSNGEVSIGQVRLSCDNWEEEADFAYTRDEAKWIADLLTRLVKFKR